MMGIYADTKSGLPSGNAPATGRRIDDACTNWQKAKDAGKEGREGTDEEGVKTVTVVTVVVVVAVVVVVE